MYDISVSTNVYAKFRCAPLRIKKVLGIFRELITTTRTTRVAFWDPPSGSKNLTLYCLTHHLRNAYVYSIGFRRISEFRMHTYSQTTGNSESINLICNCKYVLISEGNDNSMAVYLKDNQQSSAKNLLTSATSFDQTILAYN